MAVKAELKLTDGLQFLGRAGESPAVVMDTHDGGGGPTPMEMVLMGAAGCTGMDVMSILEKKRQPVDRFEMVIDGDQAEDFPKRYTAIRIKYTFFGKGIKPEAVERAIDLSQSKYCSVSASLNADVKYEYEIRES
jgi:putative redox protein